MAGRPWEITASLRGALAYANGGSEALVEYGAAKAIANGDSAGQAEKLTQHTETIAASSNTTVDLTGITTDGPLQIKVGESAAYEQVHALLIVAAKTNGGNITVEPGASNGLDIFGASGALVLDAGEFVLLTKSFTIASGDRTIKLSNDDAAAAGSVTIFILGR